VLGENTETTVKAKAGQKETVRVKVYMCNGVIVMQKSESPDFTAA